MEAFLMGLDFNEQFFNCQTLKITEQEYLSRRLDMFYSCSMDSW